MKHTFIKLNDLRLLEDYNYNCKLDFLTKFNLVNNLAQKHINKISLNFGFKQIKFNKKLTIKTYNSFRLSSKLKLHFNITLSQSHKAILLEFL